MKAFIFTMLTIMATAAYANCTVQTFTGPNGMQVCTTCCYPNAGCTTTCM